MKNKGFTLIELLAVIVILAIIALIATPIILNIIEDARNSSKERSVEMYARAVQNGIAAYKLKFPTDDNIKLYKLYKSYNGVRDFIEYDGEEINCDVNIYSTGNVYITNCEVGGQPVLKENSKDEYVSYGEETMEAHIGETVNYVATGTSYSGQWRILGVENGQVLLVSDSVQNLDLKGKDGYNNAITLLDGIAANYAGGTKAVSARSLRVEDINKVTGYNPYKTGNGEISRKGEAGEYGNTVTYSYKDGAIAYKATNGLEGSVTKYTSYTAFDGTVISAEYPNNTVTVTNSYYFYDAQSLTKERVQTDVGVQEGTKLHDLISNYGGQDSQIWLANQCITTSPSRTSWQVRMMWGDTVNAATVYHSFDADDQTTYTKGVRVVVTLDKTATFTKDANGVWQIS